MAQKPLTPTKTTITLPSGAALWIDQLSLDLGGGLIPIGYFGSDYIFYVAGAKTIRGTGTAILTDGAAGTDPTALTGTTGSMTTAWDTGDSIQFNVIFGSVAISQTYGGEPAMTFEFGKSDAAAPTVTWAEGS